MNPFDSKTLLVSVLAIGAARVPAIAEALDKIGTDNVVTFLGGLFAYLRFVTGKPLTIPNVLGLFKK